MPTEGTVTTCRYQSPALSVLAFGIPLTKKFRITFDYYAHGKLYSDEFGSDSAIPQDTKIPLSYNPRDPAQNSRTNHPILHRTVKRRPRIVLGIAGSVVLSLLWLLLLRGCS
jgi:hypothetical protein